MYILEVMVDMIKLKVFKSGNSLAIRIPKEFELQEGEVYAEKHGDTIVIIPKKSKWKQLYKELEEIPETKLFLMNRHQPKIQERDIF